MVVISTMYTKYVSLVVFVAAWQESRSSKTFEE